MNEIRQHRPAFFEGYTNDIVAFETVEELLKIPFVANFATDAPDFHQFSQSTNSLLMAEYRGGRSWWVVGFLKGPVDGLPAWTNGIYECWDGDKPVDIPGDQVRSSCGDEVQLRDGRVLMRREHKP